MAAQLGLDRHTKFHGRKVSHIVGDLGDKNLIQRETAWKQEGLRKQPTFSLTKAGRAFVAKHSNSIEQFERSDARLSDIQKREHAARYGAPQVAVIVPAGKTDQLSADGSRFKTIAETAAESLGSMTEADKADIAEVRKNLARLDVPGSKPLFQEVQIPEVVEEPVGQVPVKDIHVEWKDEKLTVVDTPESVNLAKPDVTVSGSGSINVTTKGTLQLNGGGVKARAIEAPSSPVIPEPEQKLTIPAYPALGRAGETTWSSAEKVKFFRSQLDKNAKDTLTGLATDVYALQEQIAVIQARLNDIQPSDG